MGNSQLKVQGDEELDRYVALARKGDRSALSHLVSATKDRLFRFLLFLGADEALAHDVLQETYLYALEHLRELREPKAFPRWLFLVAKNHFFNARKGRKNQPHLTVEDLDSNSFVANGADPQIILQTRRTLMKLDPDDRLAIVLVDLEGHSYSEASVIIGISKQALTSRLHRARESFHKIFYGD